MTTIRFEDLIPKGHWTAEEKKKLFSRLTSEYGFAMFPLCGVLDGHGTCGRRGEALDKAGKHPMPGVSPLAATKNPVALDAYIDDQPYCNFGIHAELSDLVVIDIDPRIGGDKSWAKFCSDYDLPDYVTMTVRTGLVDGTEDTFGCHIYFHFEGQESFIDSLGSYGLPGVDVKRKGYVVAPSSMHKSGFVYDFVEGLTPWEVGVLPLPPELDMLLRRTGDSKVPASSLPYDGPTISLADLKDSDHETTAYGLAALNGEIDRVRGAAEGSRNLTLFSAGTRLASLVAGGELSYETMHSMLLDAARRNGLDDDEIDLVLTRKDGAFERGAHTPAKAPGIDESSLAWLGDSRDHTTLLCLQRCRVSYSEQTFSPSITSWAITHLRSGLFLVSFAVAEATPCSRLQDWASPCSCVNS